MIIKRSGDTDRFFGYLLESRFSVDVSWTSKKVHIITIQEAYHALKEMYPLKRKFIPILTWILGFSLGFLGGSYIGLVLGGTFLGSFDIFAATGLEGYELSAYIGAIIGAIVLSIFGYKFGLKLIRKPTQKL